MQTASFLPVFNALEAWANEPLVALVIGAVGLIATVAGIALSLRGNKAAREANEQLRQNISEERTHIVKAIRGVLTTLYGEEAHLIQPVDTRPSPKAFQRIAGDGVRSEVKAKAPPVKMPEVAPPSLRGPYRTELAGSADTTGDGSPDLLVEQHEEGRCELKVFSWNEFDLVLIGELVNSTGAHFLVEEYKSRPVIVTLGEVGEEPVGQRYRWDGTKFSKESFEPSAALLDVFFSPPRWASPAPD